MVLFSYFTFFLFILFSTLMCALFWVQYCQIRSFRSLSTTLSHDTYIHPYTYIICHGSAVRLSKRLQWFNMSGLFYLYFSFPINILRFYFYSLYLFIFTCLILFYFYLIFYINLYSFKLRLFCMNILLYRLLYICV